MPPVNLVEARWAGCTFRLGDEFSPRLWSHSKLSSLYHPVSSSQVPAFYSVSCRTAFSPSSYTLFLDCFLLPFFHFLYMSFLTPFSRTPSFSQKQTSKNMININTNTLISTTQFGVREERDGPHVGWLLLRFCSAYLGAWVLSRTGPSAVTIHSCF